MTEQGPQITWKEYDKWQASLARDQRIQGGAHGQWSEGTPQVFIDLTKRLTAEERLLGSIFGDRELSIEDVLARPEKEPTDPVKHEALKKQMDEVLASLTGRERFVLRSRFGLEDGRSRTLRQVGIELGEHDVRGKAYSVERIRQIEAKALRKLRHPSNPHI